MIMKDGTVLDSVKMLACMFGEIVKLGCNGVLIETFPLVKDSRAEGGVASKLRN